MVSGSGQRFGQDDYEDFQKLTLRDLAEDALLFGLRMNQGICLSDIDQRFGLSEKYLRELVQFVENLSEEGLAERSNGWVRLTDSGRVRADAIAAEMPLRDEP